MVVREARWVHHSDADEEGGADMSSMIDDTRTAQGSARPGSSPVTRTSAVGVSLNAAGLLQAPSAR